MLLTVREVKGKRRNAVPITVWHANNRLLHYWILVVNWFMVYSVFSIYILPTVPISNNWSDHVVDTRDHDLRYLSIALLSKSLRKTNIWIQFGFDKPAWEEDTAEVQRRKLLRIDNPKLLSQKKRERKN